MNSDVKVKKAQFPPKGPPPPPGFKELTNTIQGVIRPNRVLNLGGVLLLSGGPGC